MGGDDSFDRAAHLRTDLAFLEGALERGESQLVVVWRDLVPLAQGRLLLLPIADAGHLITAERELVWLGTLGASGCFALDLSDDDEPLRTLARGSQPLQHEFHDLRFVGASLPGPDAALALYARGMIGWHARHRYCSRCGAETAARDGGHLRACVRDSCAAKHFPRTDPAVIMLVSDDEDRCLLGRQPGWPSGLYSTLAGFVEPGETPEQAVVREIREEAGVLVAEPRYFGCQPWPFPSSLMIGFTARALTSEIRIGDDELEDARWVTRSELVDCERHGFWVPNSFSLAGRLLSWFLSQEH